MLYGGPNGRCFLSARVVSKSTVAACMSDQNKTCQNGRVPTYPDVQPGPSNRQTFFSGRGNACGSNLPFSDHIVNTFRRPTILQLNFEGLTASKINVLYHLAVKHEALVILLQETHCTSPEKIKLPGFALAGFLSRKHALPMFVHERLKYMLLKQSPLKSEIEWCAWTLMGIK